MNLASFGVIGRVSEGRLGDEEAFKPHIIYAPIMCEDLEYLSYKCNFLPCLSRPIYVVPLAYTRCIFRIIP